jgi:hypothetical protein
VERAHEHLDSVNAKLPTSQLPGVWENSLAASRFA